MLETNTRYGICLANIKPRYLAIAYELKNFTSHYPATRLGSACVSYVDNVEQKSRTLAWLVLAISRLGISVYLDHFGADLRQPLYGTCGTIWSTSTILFRFLWNEVKHHVTDKSFISFVISAHPLQRKTHKENMQEVTRIKKKRL